MVRFLTCVAIAATMTVSACTGSDRSQPDASPPPTSSATSVPEDLGDNVLRIGLLLPTTGSGTALGEPIHEAVASEVGQINAAGGVLGQPIQLVTADENSERGLPSLLAAIPQVDAIIGPASSRVALRQLGQTVQRDDAVVTCSPSATALALEEFDDNGWFFRTIPSDSLLMTAMAIQATQLTGVSTVGVAYIDDPYGRGLSDAFASQVAAQGRLTAVASVAVPADTDDLGPAVTELLAEDPGVIVILADDTVGGRLLGTIDAQMDVRSSTLILLNDSVRTARQSIEALSDGMRNRLRVVAPAATFKINDTTTAPFAAQAVDCVDLIALATVLADTDARSEIRRRLAAVSIGGIPCREFEQCRDLLVNGRTIDFVGRSGPVDLGASGDPLTGLFDLVRFGSDGTEERSTRFEAP